LFSPSLYVPSGQVVKHSVESTCKYHPLLHVGQAAFPEDVQVAQAWLQSVQHWQESSSQAPS